jgi:hypothetical protein
VQTIGNCLTPTWFCPTIFCSRYLVAIPLNLHPPQFSLLLSLGTRVPGTYPSTGVETIATSTTFYGNLTISRTQLLGVSGVVEALVQVRITSSSISNSYFYFYYWVKVPG